MSTISGIHKVSLSDGPICNSGNSRSRAAKLLPDSSSQELVPNLVGMMGLAITLTVMISGVYALVRYLL